MTMEKELLKQKIRDAIEHSDFKNDIQTVSLFGSHAYGTPRPDSDVDMLIEFTPLSRIGLFSFLGIKHDLEDRLRMKVDLVTPDALSKYIRDEVLKKSEMIYDRK